MHEQQPILTMEWIGARTDDAQRNALVGGTPPRPRQRTFRRATPSLRASIEYQDESHCSDVPFGQLSRKRRMVKPKRPRIVDPGPIEGFPRILWRELTLQIRKADDRA